MAMSVKKSPGDESGTSAEKHDLHHLENLTGIPEDRLTEEVSENKPTLSGKILTYALAFVAGTGFTLFGSVSRCLEESSKFLLIVTTRVLCPLY